MALKTTDPIRGTDAGELWTPLMVLSGPEQHDYDYIRTVAAEAPKIELRPRVVLAQWSHETDKGTSTRWNLDKNPAGIGIPADSTLQPFPIGNGREAALIHLIALNMLVEGTVPEPSSWKINAKARAWLNDVWKKHCDAAPPVKRIADLNIRYPSRSTGPSATWAWDPGYAAKIIEHHNVLFPADPPMQFRRLLAPLGRDNTPDIFFNTSGDIGATVHENGNPKSSAAAEAGFVAKGGGAENVSYHLAVDEVEGVQILPLDRIGYHAADNCDNRTFDIGCFSSYAIETVQVLPIGGALWNRTLRNLVRLLVMIKTGDQRIDYGRTDPNRLMNAITNQHNKWSLSRKNCPQWIRDTGRWEAIIWSVQLAFDLFWMGVSEPPVITPAPTVKPHPIGNEEGKDGTTKIEAGVLWVWSNSQIVPEIDVQTHEWADATSADGPVLTAGKAVTIYWVTAVVNPVTGKAEMWGTTYRGWRVPLYQALAGEIAA